MTIAIAVKKTINLQNSKVVLCDVTMDSSYPTGGEALAPSDFGLLGINHVIVGAPPLGGFLPAYDPTNLKLKLFVSTTGTPSLLIEHANATSASTAVIPCVVFGF